jgi:hypothetical protein
VRLEGLGQLKKSTSTRTRELPACSIVPRPTTLPRAPDENRIRWDFRNLELSNFGCIRAGNFVTSSVITERSRSSFSTYCDIKFCHVLLSVPYKVKRKERLIRRSHVCPSIYQALKQQERFLSNSAWEIFAKINV